MDTLEEQYITISWKNKISMFLHEQTVENVTTARNIKDCLFQNYKSNNMLPNVWIETHILVRPKSKTFVVDYRETWNVSEKEVLVETNTHLNGASCPFHKQKFRKETVYEKVVPVIQISYGICNQCLSDKSKI